MFPALPGSPFDFSATAAGAEWIEEIGAQARVLLDAAPQTVPVVGHFAWRIETVPVADGRVQAVFDWGSVGSAPEAVVIGSAAHQFTIDGRSDRPHVPTVDEIQQFVIDDEQGRGSPDGDGAGRASARLGCDRPPNRRPPPQGDRTPWHSPS